MSYELYLEHHGIKGQKWGVLNGPPYPLGSGRTIKKQQKKAAKAIQKGDFTDLDKRLSQLDSRKKYDAARAKMDEIKKRYDNDKTFGKDAHEYMVAKEKVKEDLEIVQDDIKRSKKLKTQNPDQVQIYEDRIVQDMMRLRQLKNYKHELEKNKKLPDKASIDTLEYYQNVPDEAFGSYIRIQSGRYKASKDLIDAERKYQEEAGNFINDYLGKYGKKKTNIWINTASGSSRLTIGGAANNHVYKYVHGQN